MGVSLARRNSNCRNVSEVGRYQPFAGGLLVLALLVVCVSSPAFSSVVAVGNCVTNVPLYEHIQQAVNAVPPGTVIKVCPGTYNEQVLITESLTLTGVSENGISGPNGSGLNNPIIATPSTGVVQNATDLSDSSAIAAQVAIVTPTQSVSTPIVVNIVNIAIDGSNNLIAGCSPDLVGIYYQNASGTVSHVVARFQELPSGLGGCQAGLGIYAQSGYGTGGTSTVTIENNDVHDFQKNGITVDGSGTVATVTGNYVVGQGPTPNIAQNGIQVSDGAYGKVANNTVTDYVYVNASNCTTCYSASGILLYDSGTTSAGVTVGGNTVSNTQGAIVAYGDSFGTADNNTFTSNKITTSQAAGPYLIDGIDMCSNNNTAQSNTVFNSSGSGVHIDSQCTESTGMSGNGSTVNANTVNEACAGVLEGNGTGNTIGTVITFNVGNTSLPGDACISDSRGRDTKAMTKGKGLKRLIPQPRR